MTETLAPTLGRPVVGWLGNVVSTSPGAQFDDYLVLQPEGAGTVGLTGATPALEAEIVNLRDREEPGKRCFAASSKTSHKVSGLQSSAG